MVEDDDALREALQFELSTEGYQVLVFHAGESLLDYPLPERGACIVVDQQLPGLSGLETIQALRTRGIALPALIITTLPSPNLRLQALVAHAHIVEKPLIGNALIGHIRAALEVTA
ncbi:MAG: response regulator [Phenylobacterium sp.]